MGSKNISEHLLSPIVQVTVGEGNDKQSYHLHSSLLCEVSEYFRGCFQGGFTETASQQTTLPDVNPAAFASFANWVYTNQLALPVEKIEGENLTLRETLVDLYLLGDRILCSDLKDRAMDMMRATDTGKHVTINWLIKIAVAGLAASKMANHLVEQLADDMTTSESHVKEYVEEPDGLEFLTADAKLTSKLLETVLSLQRAGRTPQTAEKETQAQQSTTTQILPQPGVPPQQPPYTAHQVRHIQQARYAALQQYQAHHMQQMHMAQAQQQLGGGGGSMVGGFASIQAYQQQLQQMQLQQQARQD